MGQEKKTFFSCICIHRHIPTLHTYTPQLHHKTQQNKQNPTRTQSWSTKAWVSWPCSFPGCVVHCSHTGFLCSSHALPALFQGLFSHRCRLCLTAAHGSSILISEGPPSLDYLHSSRNKPSVLFPELLPQSETTQLISLLIFVLVTIN